MSTNSKNFAQIRVWLDMGLDAAALDPTDLRSVTLAQYLEADVQASENGVHHYLRWLNDVLSGKLEAQSITGNAFTVTIDREDVVIENEYIEEFIPYHYTHEEFRTALMQVLTLLGKSNTDHSSNEEA